MWSWGGPGGRKRNELWREYLKHFVRLIHTLPDMNSAVTHTQSKQEFLALSQSESRTISPAANEIQEPWYINQSEHGKCEYKPVELEKCRTREVD